jgi:AmmeMemoRadiSam system protein A
MTIAAATDDPRFPPVHLDEVPTLDIEISALTPIQPVRPEDIVVGRHGLLIRLGSKAGLLLPQVAETYQWSSAEFLRQVCRKAGLSGEAWREEGAELYSFECVVWGEEE